MRCPLCSEIFTVAEAAPSAQPVAPRAVPLADFGGSSDAGNTSASKSASPQRIHVEYVTETTGHETPSAANRSQRTSHGSGVLRQLAGTVLGGIVGLAIGYVILLRIGGARVDFLDIAPYLPSFLVGDLQDEAPDKTQPETDEQPATQLPQHRAPGPRHQPLAKLFPPPDTGRRVPIAPAAEFTDTADSASAAVDPTTAGQLPGDYLGPREITWYTPADFGAALIKAHRALGCAHCNSTGQVVQIESETEQIDGRVIEHKKERLAECPVCRGEPVSRITPDVYRELAELAHVATFIKITGDDDATVWNRKEAAVRILQQAGAKRDRAKAIGRLAIQWLRDPARDTDGVALAGTIQQVDREGPFHRTRIVLFGLPEVVTVLSDRPPPLATQDRAIILGSVVDRPGEQIVGYQGAEQQIVWGGLPVKLAFSDE